MRDSEKQAAAFALYEVRLLSTGLYTTAMLRAMGHPYATRDPKPPQDAAIINRQTGRFHDGWRISGPRRVSGKLRTKIINETRYAIYLDHGTQRMIKRPIRERLIERLRPVRLKIYKKALKELLLGK